MQWLEGEVERLWRLNALPGDARQNETARHLAAATRQLYDYGNRMDCLEWMYAAAAAQANRMMTEDGDQLERAKKDRKRAEDAKNNAQRREAQAKKRDGEGAGESGDHTERGREG